MGYTLYPNKLRNNSTPMNSMARNSAARRGVARVFTLYQCFAKCRFTCQFDRLSDYFAKHCPVSYTPYNRRSAPECRLASVKHAWFLTLETNKVYSPAEDLPDHRGYGIWLAVRRGRAGPPEAAGHSAREEVGHRGRAEPRIGMRAQGGAGGALDDVHRFRGYSLYPILMMVG